MTYDDCSKSFPMRTDCCDASSLTQQHTRSLLLQKQVSFKAAKTNSNAFNNRNALINETDPYRRVSNLNPMPNSHPPTFIHCFFNQMIKSNQRNAPRASCARRSSVQINYKRKLSLFFTTPPPPRRVDSDPSGGGGGVGDDASIYCATAALHCCCDLMRFSPASPDGFFRPPIPRRGDKFIARIDFYATLLGLALSFFDAFQSIIVGSGRRRRRQESQFHGGYTTN
ncbi:hypothetical protein RP20_CCG025799 [Aedes albopictus]|nr:hypothetical protein RP20_CCG025799 [Aedes albopictus]